MVLYFHTQSYTVTFDIIFIEQLRTEKKFASWANILWLLDTFAYLFRFPGEYYKVTIIIYWIEVLPFVGLKEYINL